MRIISYIYEGEYKAVNKQAKLHTSKIRKFKPKKFKYSRYSIAPAKSKYADYKIIN